MTILTALLRLLAILAGGIILASISLATVEATKATGADELAIYALGLGVFVAAVTIPNAWGSRRWLNAAILVFCLIAGEGYNFLKTAERELAGREAAETLVNTALQARETLVANVTKAETALTKANAAIADSAKEKGCKAECSKLLTAAVEAARRDVATAKADLAGASIPASATPLADRSGMASWMLDLLAAALKSIAVNGFAAALIAFGAHSAPVARASRVADQITPNVAPAHPPRIIVSDEPAPMAPETVFAQKKAAALASDGNVTDLDLAAVAALFRGDVEPDGTGGPGGGARIIRPKRWARDEVRADLERTIARGETFPSQRAMASRYGVPTTTLHDWFRMWAEEGQEVRRRQHGRRKMVG